MLKTGFTIFLFVCLANRLLFGVEEYNRLSIERNNDLHMFDICQQVDYKKIGRHARLCADLEYRLRSSLLFHTTKAVVDDTLYREATLTGIIQTGLGIIFLCLGSSVYSRYIKERNGFDLPQTNKLIKQD